MTLGFHNKQGGILKFNLNYGQSIGVSSISNIMLSVNEKSYTSAGWRACESLSKINRRSYWWVPIRRWAWSLICRRTVRSAAGRCRMSRMSTSRTSSDSSDRRTETTWCRSCTCCGTVRAAPTDSFRRTTRPRWSGTYCRCLRRRWIIEIYTTLEAKHLTVWIVEVNLHKSVGLRTEIPEWNFIASSYWITAICPRRCSFSVTETSTTLLLLGAGKSYIK